MMVFLKERSEGEERRGEDRDQEKRVERDYLYLPTSFTKLLILKS